MWNMIFSDDYYINEVLTILSDDNVKRIFDELRAQPSTKQKKQQIDDLFQ